MSEQGRKYDGGKLRYDLVPALALEEVVKVITKGAEKYDPENWKRVPEGRRRYYAAAMRHMEAWRKGEKQDEIGTHHIANAISNLMFILEKELNGWEDTEEFHTGEFHTGGFLPATFETEYLTPLISEIRNLREDVKRMNNHFKTDISQETLKVYIDSVVEDQDESLWYPPVEEGGNPWIEWCPTPWGICPKEVSESTMVDVLMDYEREEEDFETSPQQARYWYWGDSSIVAYRVV